MTADNEKGPLVKEWEQRPRFLSACQVALLLARLLATALACDGLFNALLLARFQVVGMAFNFLDNVVLLNLALKAPESVL